MSDESIHGSGGILRFNMAVQRTRAMLVVATIPFFFVAKIAGFVPNPPLPYLTLIAVAVLSAAFFHELYRRGIDRFLGYPLHYFWMPFDVVALTLAVHFTGGLSSLWFIGYLTNSATAAFARGKRAAWFASIADIVAYFILLFATGQIAFFDSGFYTAAFRIAFLFGTAFFLLTGIANLQEKRLTIVAMKELETKKVEELMQVTRELELKSRELAEANRRIREADRAKSQFLANMSHELRTPMNSIIGFSEILLERLNGKVDPRYLEFQRHILNSGQHLLEILNDVLDLSKIEAGKMELFPESFPVAHVAEGVCNVMRAQAAKQSITIVNEIPAELPQLEADLAKFKQVLYNLLSNAVKFSPQGSLVAVRGKHNPEENPESITVSIVDNGIGIAPENHELIFQEFRQVDGTTRREHGGTGLGLALVKKFLELQNGRIELESEPGKGSTFSFTMPIHFAGPRDTTVTAAEEQLLQLGDRVLVIEDDALAFESVAGHLQSSGYIPVRARNGDEALRLARRISPLAITLDIVLPDMDGFEVLKQLKADAQTSSIPVVIISMVDGRELGLALGAHDYFVKPVDRGRFVERVNQIARPTATRKPRLLVIDDDRTFHDMLEHELTTLGFEVTQAYSGAEGIDLAATANPDVIILDLMMPGMSGFEVAEILKSRPETARIPIVVMTAKELTSEDRQQLQSKIHSLVPKGQSKARLLAAIRQLSRPSAAP